MIYQRDLAGRPLTWATRVNLRNNGIHAAMSSHAAPKGHNGRFPGACQLHCRSCFGSCLPPLHVKQLPINMLLQGGSCCAQGFTQLMHRTRLH